MRSRSLAALWLPVTIVLAGHSPAGRRPSTVAQGLRQTRSAGATIVLPQQLVAGEPATLAVLDANGRLLPGAGVEFSGGKRVTTDETGRAAFRAPDETGVMFTRLSGGAATATSTVTASTTDVAEGVQIIQLPRVVLLSEPFDVRGSGFRGEADANRVYLGEVPAVVLAASPVALVVLPGREATPGPAQFVLEVAGRSPGPVPIRLVTIEMIAPAAAGLKRGEKGTLQVRVRGSEEPLDLDVRNLSPDVVRLEGGDVQRVRTRGGGENSAPIVMEGLHPGEYSISARLVHSLAGLPDTEAARQLLISAHSLAPKSWAPRLDKLIAWLGESPQNSLRVRNELERMLAEGPEGEFGLKLEAAWRALL